MNSNTNIDPNQLHIFHEGRKRRIFVAKLIYYPEKERYELHYDQHYLKAKNAIPMGPELDLFKTTHTSEKGKLFPSFIDRIPLRANPAYNDYCQSQGIDPNEENLIILLGSIGTRGPSSFIFEPVFSDDFSATMILSFRHQLQISQHDLATAFDINKLTLQKIEIGKSHDFNTLKRLQIYFEFPEVALWQLKISGGKIHSHVRAKLIQYFESKR